MTKKNYRTLSPELTEKIVAAFGKAHGRFPLPQEALAWAKSAAGRAALGVDVRYDEAPTNPREHKMKMAAIADANDEFIAAGTLTWDEIFARFDVVFGIIRGVPAAQDGFLRVGPLKGLGEFMAAGERTVPDREVTITALNVAIEDVVPLMERYCGEVVAGMIKQHGEAGMLEELGRRLWPSTPTQ